MKLSECLIEKAITVQLGATDKNAILSALVTLIGYTNGVMDESELLAEVLRREELGSTGIGKGVAIPHVHLENVNELHVAMITTSGGVEYDAIDDESCYVFIMVVAPDSHRESYLHLLAEVSRLFREEELREAVLGANTAGELIEILREAEK